MSQEIIAYCGLDCMACPAYQATIKDDRQMREETAANWSKEFNTVLKADDINCVGCLAEQGVLFEHCQVCKIMELFPGKRFGELCPLYGISLSGAGRIFCYGT